MSTQPSERGRFHDRRNECHAKVPVPCPKPRNDGDPSRPVWVDEWVERVLAAERRIRTPGRARREGGEA